MDIYERIHEFCKGKGISIREIERRCEFAQGTIKRWSSITPGVDKVVKVSEVLGCSVDELLGLYHDPDELARDDLVGKFINEMRNQSPDEGMLIQAYRLIPAEHRIEAIDAVLQLKNKYFKL